MNQKLIEINDYPVKDVLDLLMIDHSTQKNIIWATDMYSEYGNGFLARNEIKASKITGDNSVLIQPRILKSLDEQAERTRKKAEVFTPAWICCKMNNHLDDEWFGKPDVFNILTENRWESTEERIPFKNEKAWQKYVDSRRLEITCGEAPYIVSRYDMATGEYIPIRNRIGILDRKLRVVNENTDNEKDWIKWATRAFESTYGYEYQGDNLLIARINLLMTFTEYLRERFNREATASELKNVIKIITWNIWQMDGLTMGVPLGAPKEDTHQITFFEFMGEKQEEFVKCRIYDWRSNESLLFESMKKGV